MEDWRSAFAEEWDAVVLGTGMKECLLSGLLSVAGKKVLHVDRNNYYGGASASLDIQQLFSKFAGAEEPSAPAHHSAHRQQLQQCWSGEAQHRPRTPS
tara:strand:+ start:142 stop:435 length:294 start_codon:yes stop_codon:yes gene_type:complete